MDPRANIAYTSTTSDDTYGDNPTVGSMSPGLVSTEGTQLADMYNQSLGSSGVIINGSSMDNNSSNFLNSTQWSETIRVLFSILDYSSSTAVIVGCLLPYVPQYFTIYHNQSCSGFSTYVCLTQLIANILRITFWFGHPFELPLLIQSCVMITGQLLLMELCVRVKAKWGRVSSKTHHFLSLEFGYFWKWTSFISYIEFLTLFSIISAGIMYVFILYEQVALIEAIGFVSVLIESMLGIPQLIKNYRKKSVVGMSLGMVFMWLLGDLYKTAYFIIRNAPKQFWLCGTLQVTIDLLVLCQVCIYRKKGTNNAISNYIC